MAKLPPPATAGHNAGANYNVRYMKIDDIIIDPEIAGIFETSDRIKGEITESIKKFKFDKSQPLVLEKGTNKLLDGHTRLAAAKEAGLSELPVIEKEFESHEAAVIYTIERQFIRRNLTGPEIVKVIELIPKGRKANDGAGRAAELLAQRLGIGTSTVYKAAAIIREATPETIEAVKKGEISIKKGYKQTKALINPPKEKIVVESATQSLPGNLSFLKASVILLVEAGQRAAAELLINHFLKKKEKYSFYDLLPEAIKSQLPRLPLVVSDD